MSHAVQIYRAPRWRCLEPRLRECCLCGRHGCEGPYTEAPPPVLLYDWSGFYIGANGGWGSSSKCWDFTTPAGVFAAAEGCHDATGGTVGGQIGYRWQASQWVFGLEAQGNWADFHGSNVSLAFPAFGNDTRVDAFGLFTGQVGYALNNALLLRKGRRRGNLGSLSQLRGRHRYCRVQQRR